MSSTQQLDLTAEDEAEMMEYLPPESDAELISGRKAGVLATARARSSPGSRARYAPATSSL
ncbi:hypothetical protein ACFXPX_01385 [Kitasatospora sp. NPDC059146]|uniref:hypothetical protein n=1 Tax=unclassified Kitasatospora TaxID=2633591 RepID=UPI0036887165